MAPKEIDCCAMHYILRHANTNRMLRNANKQHELDRFACGTFIN